MTLREFWTYMLSTGLLTFGVTAVMKAGWSVRTALAFVPFLLTLPVFLHAHKDGERKRSSGEAPYKVAGRWATGWRDTPAVLRRSGFMSVVCGIASTVTYVVTDEAPLLWIAVVGIPAGGALLAGVARAGIKKGPSAEAEGPVTSN